MVIKVPGNKISRIDIINIKGGMTANQVYKKYKPDFLINLALYDSINTGINITKLEDENSQAGYLFSNEGIGIKGDNELIWCKHQDAINSDEIRDYVSGSPVLIKNGQKNIDWGNKHSEYIDKNHVRSAIGFNNEEVVLLVSGKKMSLTELSQAMEDNKCQYAINCDGGGSSHLQKKEKIYRKSTRNNASWLLIWEKTEIAYIDHSGFPQVKGEDNVSEQIKIFIGVGHGGNDPGAVANNHRESDINLVIARTFRDELERHGIKVLMSRISNENDPLEEEIRECNDFNPTLAVDVHTNAGGGDGWEAYYHHLGGNSIKIAKAIENEVIKIGQNSRGCKTKLNSAGNDYYGFIRSIKCSSVIVETGFIDNKTDLKDFDEEHEQKQFGIAYAKGILKFLGIPYQSEIIDDWKVKEYQKARTNGIITDESWVNKLNDKIEVAYLFAMLNNMCEGREKDNAK